MNSLGTINISTNRLLLRPFRYADAEFMFENWANDPDVTKTLTWNVHENVSATKSIIESWIEHYQYPDYFQWAICLRDNPNEPIGSISMDVKGDVGIIGYALSKKFWNKKIMSEAVENIINYMFSVVKLRKIVGEVVENNIYSQKIFEKFGFKYLGKTSKWLSLKKESVNVLYFELEKPSTRVR